MFESFALHDISYVFLIKAKTSLNDLIPVLRKLRKFAQVNGTYVMLNNSRDRAGIKSSYFLLPHGKPISTVIRLIMLERF